MSYRQLFLLLEGDDDERFFRSVVLPLLGSAYDDVRVVQISGLRKEKVNGYLRSIASMKADYILVRDLDWLPCATAAKDRILKSFPACQSGPHPDRQGGDRELVAVPGIPEGHAWRSLKIGRCPETSVVTKEAFEAAVRPGEHKVPVMLALLEEFDLQTAIHRNDSFRRFLRKFVPPSAGG